MRRAPAEPAAPPLGRLTLAQMAALLVSMNDKMFMTPAEAADFAREVLPKLRRWREAPHAAPAP